MGGAALPPARVLKSAIETKFGKSYLPSVSDRSEMGSDRATGVTRRRVTFTELGIV